MCKILLAINPNHVENIMTGIKKYEFRKIKCKENIDKTIIYSTFPVMKVVEEAKVIEVIVSSPESVWNETDSFSETTKQFFDDYYQTVKGQLRIN